LISNTFIQLPVPLRQAAIYLGLTVSTTQNPHTLSGDQSAVYGSWSSDHSHISPHLEMSETSLSSVLIFPHLLHECSHLFWAIQTQTAKDRYKSLMMATCKTGFVEVTTYAHGFYNEWQKLLLMDGFAIQQRRANALDKWVVESFCETVAKICCPWYKTEENRCNDELLKSRHEAIYENFGLAIDRQYRVA